MSNHDATHLGGLLIRLGWATPKTIAFALRQQHAGVRRKLGDILIEHGLAPPAHIYYASFLQDRQRKREKYAAATAEDIAKWLDLTTPDMEAECLIPPDDSSLTES